MPGAQPASIGPVYQSKGRSERSTNRSPDLPDSSAFVRPTHGVAFHKHVNAALLEAQTSQSPELVSMPAISDDMHYGYRRVHVMLRGEGHKDNVERDYRCIGSKARLSA